VNNINGNALSGYQESNLVEMGGDILVHKFPRAKLSLVCLRHWLTQQTSVFGSVCSTEQKGLAPNLMLTVELQRMNEIDELLSCIERVNSYSSKFSLSPSHNCVTRLKWLRVSQPLPEDAPAYRQIGARKVTDGREPSRIVKFILKTTFQIEGASAGLYVHHVTTLKLSVKL
jgi:hypothetical protein